MLILRKYYILFLFFFSSCITLSFFSTIYLSSFHLTLIDSFYYYYYPAFQSHFLFLQIYLSEWAWWFNVILNKFNVILNLSLFIITFIIYYYLLNSLFSVAAVQSWSFMWDMKRSSLKFLKWWKVNVWLPLLRGISFAFLMVLNFDRWSDIEVVISPERYF